MFFGTSVDSAVLDTTGPKILEQPAVQKSNGLAKHASSVPPKSTQLESTRPYFLPQICRDGAWILV